MISKTISKMWSRAVCLRPARLIGTEKTGPAANKPFRTPEEEAKYEELIRARVFAGLDLPRVPRPEQITQPLQVHTLANGGFMVNKQWIPGSILIFPKRCFIWGVTQPREIKPHTLELIKYLKPKPRNFVEREKNNNNRNRVSDNRDREGSISAAP